MMNEEKKYACSECGRSYDYYKNLRKHVSVAHPGKLNDLAPRLRVKKVFKYLCSLCGRQFNQERNLRYHERKVHALENKINVSKIKCSLCDISVHTRKCYYDHLSVKHDLTIESEETEFASFQEFSNWKKEIERNTLSFYVKQQGSYGTSGNATRHLFVCHRSGQYVSKSKGIRQIKAQGTNKIGGVCPSSIEVTEAGDGRCKVKYVVTHVGHKNDISHLRLTEEERKTLAVDIANRMPFDAILDKIRDTSPESKLQRIHLLTKKDLYNIQQCTNLRSDVMGHKENGTSSEAQVNSHHKIRQLISSVNTNDDTLSIYEGGEPVSESENILVEIIYENIELSDLSQQKAELKKQFADLIDTITSQRQMQIVEDHLSSLKATLAAVDTNVDQRLGPYIASPKTKQNIHPQRQLFPTKKRKKPSTAES